MSALMPPAPLQNDHVKWPGEQWEIIEQSDDESLSVDERTTIDNALDGLSTTSFVAIKNGKILYSYGDITEPSYLASTRKSILSMLYGKAVYSKEIDLDLTMEDLRIDEDEPLLPIERNARLRDLLVSCSGVYHKPGSPGSNTKNIPERGSKAPGSYFHYNNWDFNVLGHAFEKLTGRSVFKAFEEDFAKPLQLEDFDPMRQRMLGYEGRSRYLAYHFFLSARDMARLGLLMVRNGEWRGKDIIPSNWVRESTKIRVTAEQMNESRKSRIAGYSYLWWVPTTSAETPEWEDAYVAAGHFGQFILCLPKLDMVLINRRAISDEQAIARNDGSFTEELPAVTMEQFLAVADHFVASHRNRND